VVDEEAKLMRGPSIAPRYLLAKAERTLRVPGLGVRLFRGAHTAWTRVFRRDPSMRFTIEYESQIEKGFFTARSLIADRDLRLLFRLGRRAGAPLDRLLREIMELSLLRKAADGVVFPGQDFTLNTEFDASTKALCFVSTPIGHREPKPEIRPDQIREAVHAGHLRIIEWDHRALGGILHLQRPDMEVGIGFEGLESFTVIAGIGRQNPSALERALGPVLSAVERVPSAVE
jgi:hypothetical protein